MQGNFSKKYKIMNRDKLKVCRYFDSGNIIKRGIRKTKQCNIQRYLCKDCNKRFTTNYGFESMRYDDITVTSALQMYFSGMGVRKIVDHYDMLGTEVSYQTIYN